MPQNRDFDSAKTADQDSIPVQNSAPDQNSVPGQTAPGREVVSARWPAAMVNELDAGNAAPMVNELGAENAVSNDKSGNVPAIRFRGFTYAWEQRRLGDVVVINSGKDYKHLNLGSIPVYGTGGFICSVDEALSQATDAIGVGRKGTIDKPFLLKAPFWTVDTLFYVIPEVGSSLYFYLMTFQKIKWKQEDESTGVPSLSKETITRIPCHIGELDEQEKVGRFFERLDRLITIHQRKCEKGYFSF